MLEHAVLPAERAVALLLPHELRPAVVGLDTACCGEVAGLSR
jgi:hypothetical protein